MIWRERFSTNFGNRDNLGERTVRHHLTVHPQRRQLQTQLALMFCCTKATERGGAPRPVACSTVFGPICYHCGQCIERLPSS
jgi:hypothetical protein